MMRLAVLVPRPLPEVREGSRSSNGPRPHGTERASEDFIKSRGVCRCRTDNEIISSRNPRCTLLRVLGSAPLLESTLAPQHVRGLPLDHQTRTEHEPRQLLAEVRGEVLEAHQAPEERYSGTGCQLAPWQHACACEGHALPAASCVGDRARVETLGKCSTPERCQLPTS